MHGTTLDMKEILVHISAPTSYQDDERYRRLAEAYDDFEPAASTHYIAGACKVANVNGRTPRHVSPGIPATVRAIGRQPAHRGVIEEEPSAHPTIETPRVKETPVTIGFVEPAQIVPDSLKSTVKGRKLELYAQAPDFGSFTSTPASRMPIEQLLEEDRRFTQQQRSSVKRNASGRPKSFTPGKAPHPLFIEDTQETLVALEDHADSSSFGSWPSSSAESPTILRSSKRSCLLDESPDTEIIQASYHAKAPASDAPIFSSAWAPLPRMPPTGSMSSEMPDDYHLGNVLSASLRTSEQSEPGSANGSALNRNPGATPRFRGLQNIVSKKQHPSLAQARPDGITRVISQPSASVQDALVPVQFEASVNNQGRVLRASTQKSFEIVQKDKQSSRLSTTVSKNITQSQRLDFSSLPLHLLPKQPSAEKRLEFNGVTSMLERYVKKTPIAHYYKPAAVTRTVGDEERGCWMFDTSNWEPICQHEFWTRMQYLLERGYLGDIWLQRNVPENLHCDGTDGGEANGLGVVWVFCWGQVVPYLWIMLLVESKRQIQKSKACWAVGPIEELEVVVRMPQTGHTRSKQSFHDTSLHQIGA
ncbi:hypothetical protein B0J12DRAFT_636956 [Macrophomina phaseolina]|uniref:Uncharacterized protein n=1 Tax=Macrophomina phaseolina TaxID=35725 RepID=A0ABQ8GWK3_9PEZI|nr:hypothetical protein B0J12DRAFT_636956 [Macrophomina phaseolina]